MTKGFKKGDIVSFKDGIYQFDFKSLPYDYRRPFGPNTKGKFTVKKSWNTYNYGNTQCWVVLEEQTINCPILANKFVLCTESLQKCNVKYKKEYTIKVCFSEDQYNWIRMDIIGGDLPIKVPAIRTLSKDTWKNQFGITFEETPKVGDLIVAENKMKAKILFMNEKGFLIEYTESWPEKPVFISIDNYKSYWRVCHD